MTGSDSVDETARRTRRQLGLFFFLVIWPVGNLLMISTVLQNEGLLRFETLGTAALRLWFVSGAALMVLRWMERYFPALLHPDHFVRQGVVHVVVMLGIGALSIVVAEPPPGVPLPSSLLVPRLVVVLEIVLYISVLRSLRLQQRAYETVARAREAELHVLRAQSNPHFLFNTLNLITSEITTRPENARAIVWDLADLMRSNIKMARQNLTSLGDEIELVRLYLRLQQRRFEDRLTYAIDVPPETERIQIPALLLQPVIENTIKWAVAPCASPVHVVVASRLTEEHLHITAGDSGPAFDETKVVEGDGFRILRKTLELHYADRAEMKLRSTAQGGVFSLTLPLDRRGS